MKQVRNSERCTSTTSCVVGIGIGGDYVGSPIPLLLALLSSCRCFHQDALLIIAPKSLPANDVCHFAKAQLSLGFLLFTDTFEKLFLCSSSCPRSPHSHVLCMAFSREYHSRSSPQQRFFLEEVVSVALLLGCFCAFLRSCETCPLKCAPLYREQEGETHPTHHTIRQADRRGSAEAPQATHSGGGGERNDDKKIRKKRSPM